MEILNASLFTEDVVKFALGVAFITLVIFIVWLLLREMRLWYWKINNLLKALKHVDKRLSRLESRMDALQQEVDIIKMNTIKMSDLFDKALMNCKAQDESSNINDEDEENEEEIAHRIKD